MKEWERTRQKEEEVNCSKVYITNYETFRGIVNGCYSILLKGNSLRTFDTVALQNFEKNMNYISTYTSIYKLCLERRMLPACHSIKSDVHKVV
jgi:hypothetical protein